MNPSKVTDTSNPNQERTTSPSRRSLSPPAPVTLQGQHERQDSHLRANGKTSSEMDCTDSDLAKHVQEMIQDIHEIIAKVDEFQFQMKIAWRHQKGTP